MSSIHRGEIQVRSTNKARNENNNPFTRSKIGRKGDMMGVLSRTSQKPQKAEILFGEVSVMLKDSINSLLKGWDYINAEERKSIILYGWTLHVNKEIIPSSEDCAGMFEDLYCVFKELE
ncbi:7942_t:CDS:2, partial [Entrophospora sp. SA101]